MKQATAQQQSQDPHIIATNHNRKPLIALKSKRIPILGKASLSRQKYQNLAMFLLAMTQPHGEKFIANLEAITTLKPSLPQLSGYLSANYQHLTKHARYYVLAVLLDYRAVAPGKSSQSTSLEPEHELVIQPVVEELSRAYHRESMWFQKISGIAIYEMFELMDRYKTGYLTMSGIAKFISAHIPFEPVSKLIIKTSAAQKNSKGIRPNQSGLLQLRLSGNINRIGHGSYSRIYLQNWAEVLGRLDAAEFDGRLTNCYPYCAYYHIEEELKAEREGLQRKAKRKKESIVADQSDEIAMRRCVTDDLRFKRFASAVSRRTVDIDGNKFISDSKNVHRDHEQHRTLKKADYVRQDLNSLGGLAREGRAQRSNNIGDNRHIDSDEVHTARKYPSALGPSNKIPGESQLTYGVPSLPCLKIDYKEPMRPYCRINSICGQLTNIRQCKAKNNLLMLRYF